jgi:hypothetical protein
MQPRDEYYDAKVKVLGEYIKHHVKEEEQPGGVFSQPKKGHEDLDEMGERIKARKEELMAEYAPAAGNSKPRKHLTRLVNRRPPNEQAARTRGRLCFIGAKGRAREFALDLLAAFGPHAVDRRHAFAC